MILRMITVYLQKNSAFIFCWCMQGALVAFEKVVLLSFFTKFCQFWFPKPPFARFQVLPHILCCLRWPNNVGQNQSMFITLALIIDHNDTFDKISYMNMLIMRLWTLKKKNSLSPFNAFQNQRFSSIKGQVEQGLAGFSSNRINTHFCPENCYATRWNPKRNLSTNSSA